MTPLQFDFLIRLLLTIFAAILTNKDPGKDLKNQNEYLLLCEEYQKWHRLRWDLEP